MADEDAPPDDEPEAGETEPEGTGEHVTGSDVAADEAAGDEPVVVTGERQPETEEVVQAEPEAGPEPEMLHGVLVGHSRGQVVLHPRRDEYVELVGRLREAGYWTCVDLCAVDYLGYAAPRSLPPGIDAERFEVVAMFLDHVRRERVRVRVQVPEDDPTVPSLFALHPGLENPEREAYDMFGIVFEGHPDLTRILMPEEWEGHPLRKDAAVGRIPVQFKAPRAGR